jgi:hypothetical protein
VISSPVDQPSLKIEWGRGRRGGEGERGRRGGEGERGRRGGRGRGGEGERGEISSLFIKGVSNPDLV